MALGGTDLIFIMEFREGKNKLQCFSGKYRIQSKTHDGLSFPHQELQSDADAVQKHHPTPAAAAEHRPDMAEHIHAIVVIYYSDSLDNLCKTSSINGNQPIESEVDVVHGRGGGGWWLDANWSK